MQLLLFTTPCYLHLISACNTTEGHPQSIPYYFIIMTMPLISRSILSSSRRLLPTTSFFLTPYHTANQNITAATNNTQQSVLLSTSPDYTNYESWHKNNYEDESHNNTTTNNTNLDILQNNFQDENSSNSTTAAKFNHPVEGPRTSVLMELTDSVGALHDVLRFL